MSENIPGTIMFLDKRYTFAGLEQAINKSTETYIEPNSKHFETEFDKALFPETWKEKFKKPILTIREGHYVVIYSPVEIDWTKGFKARFVSKYNFGHAVYIPPPTPEELERMRQEQAQEAERDYKNVWHGKATQPNRNERPRTSRFGGRSN